MLLPTLAKYGARLVARSGSIVLAVTDRKLRISSGCKMLMPYQLVLLCEPDQHGDSLFHLIGHSLSVFGGLAVFAPAFNNQVQDGDEKQIQHGGHDHSAEYGCSD